MTRSDAPTLRLTGLVAATHTPFRADGSLNLAAVEAQAAYLLAHQVTRVFIGGTTGESHSLTLEERRELAQRWVEVARGTPLQVVVHVGANCLAEARSLAAQAQAIGARAIAALAPSYFKPRQVEVLVAGCAEIASGAPETPFYYYEIPALTGIGISPVEFLAHASGRIPTLAGIKFSSADLVAYQVCRREADGAFDLPYGIDECLLAALALGAEGGVGSTYNFAAPVFHRLLQAFARGDLAAARQEQFRAVQLVRCIAKYGYLPASKTVMRMLGVDVGGARLPLVTLDSRQERELRRDLEQLGFFAWIQS